MAVTQVLQLQLALQVMLRGLAVEAVDTKGMKLWTTEPTGSLHPAVFGLWTGDSPALL